MGEIHYEAVFPDGRFESSNSLPDLIQNGGYLFLVEKERGYSCNTYSHYKAIIIDESGTPAQAIVNGFSFNSFSIYGNAADYILYLPYYTPEGIFGSHEFKNDISYNHPLEGFSKIKPEWSIDSQYKVFFSFFESIAKYGKESYKRIIQLEREAYANDAAYRLEKHEFEGFRSRLEKASEFIQELIIPDGRKDIYDWEFEGLHFKEIKRIFLPGSLKTIGNLPFGFCGDKNIQVFCHAEEPPLIVSHYRSYSTDSALYVHKNSLEKYMNNPDWSAVFPVIKGF